MSDWIIKDHHRERARAKRTPMYCIEGETLDIDAVAQRLGVTNPQASWALRAARLKPEAVTWSLLREIAARKRS